MKHMEHIQRRLERSSKEFGESITALFEMIDQEIESRDKEIAALKSALVEACGIADASLCVGPNRSEEARLEELRALAKGER